MKRWFLPLFAALALNAGPPLERAKPEPAPVSMSAGATALDEAFTQEFAEERQPEKVTLRYANESWELDWEDWWAYRQGEFDLEGLVAKVRIKVEGVAAAPRPVQPVEASPKPNAEGLPVIWLVAGLGLIVLLVLGVLLWALLRRNERRPRRQAEPMRGAPPPPPLPAPVPTRLFFHTGPLAGQSVLLGQGIRLGREKDCHVVVEDPSVSRHHADLIQIPQGWTLRDLGSSNGTTVNGVRIQGEVLLRGDEVLVFGGVRAQLSAG